MPISKIPTQNEGEEQFKFTNGELQALKDVVETWQFKDSISALRFAIAVLVQASENKSLFIEEEGRKIELVPSQESLVKTDPKKEVEKIED